MRKTAIAIGLAIVVVGLGLVATSLLVPRQADAEVVVTLVGPVTYADSQWKSIRCYNKNGANYKCEIVVCPKDETLGVQALCTTSEISQPTAPAPLQTIANALINQWRSDHPGYDPP